MKHSMLVLILAATHCQGQGTFTVTFDVPPIIPPTVYDHVHEYYESGMWVRAELPTGYFDRYTGGATRPNVPDNGTAYLRSAGLVLLFGLTNSATFDLLSVDLTRASAVDADPSIGSFVGYLPDGSTVSTNFSPSGLVFQTFQFGPEFSGLTRVEIPSAPYWPSWALDNLVFSTIPEPSTLSLFGFGILLLGATLIRKRRSSA